MFSSCREEIESGCTPFFIEVTWLVYLCHFKKVKLTIFDIYLFFFFCNNFEKIITLGEIYKGTYPTQWAIWTEFIYITPVAIIYYVIISLLLFPCLYSGVFCHFACFGNWEVPIVPPTSNDNGNDHDWKTKMCLVVIKNLLKGAKRFFDEKGNSRKALSE